MAREDARLMTIAGKPLGQVVNEPFGATADFRPEARREQIYPQGQPIVSSAPEARGIANE